MLIYIDRLQKGLTRLQSLMLVAKTPAAVCSVSRRFGIERDLGNQISSAYYLLVFG